MLPLLLALAQAPDSGAVYSGRDRRLDVAIPRLDAAVAIDGVLDEPVWDRAARLVGFSQYRPVDGRPAEDSTEVLVWYAADAIVFGVRGFEAHGPVSRATLADRDNIGTDDRIQILLDTFNDRRRALLFAVNPLGVQQDGVWSDGIDAGAAGGPSAGFRFDATIDLNPDFIYQSRGRLTAAGYEVEIRMPFKSLRYQSVDWQNWGLQIVRVTQHTGWEGTWTPAVRANPSLTSTRGSPTSAATSAGASPRTSASTPPRTPTSPRSKPTSGRSSPTSGSPSSSRRSGRSSSRDSSSTTRRTASSTPGASCSPSPAPSSPASWAGRTSPSSRPWTSATPRRAPIRCSTCCGCAATSARAPPPVWSTPTASTTGTTTGSPAGTCAWCGARSGSPRPRSWARGPRT